MYIQDDRTPTLGENLKCKQEPQNKKDLNAIAMTRDVKVAGHVPLLYTHYVSHFKELESSSISCEVTGKRLSCGVAIWARSLMQVQDSWCSKGHGLDSKVHR